MHSFREVGMREMHSFREVGMRDVICLVFRLYSYVYALSSYTLYHLVLYLLQTNKAYT